MPFRKTKTKNFKLKKDAVEWAKKEKDKSSGQIKWETNRTNNPDRPWQAVIFRNV